MTLAQLTFLADGAARANGADATPGAGRRPPSSASPPAEEWDLRELATWAGH